MTWSLNELEAMSRKAARGSGLSWGLAEEAGRASRWLAAHGLPAPVLLAGLLTRNDGVAYADLVPDCDAEVWTARSGTLCPLITGVALSDRRNALAAGQEIRLDACGFPAVLLPFAAAAARDAGVSLVVAWEGVRIGLGPEGACLDGSPEALLRHEACPVTIRQGTAEGGKPFGFTPRCEMPAGAAAVLERFAHRTYAPATEESRKAGAGAGLTDND